MKNYLRTFWLTAFLLLLCQSISAHDFEVDGIYYNFLSTNKTVQVSYQGNDISLDEYAGDVVIPPSVTYQGTTYSVTSIGNSAFYGCTGLTSIEIPNSVTSIGYGAFSYCSGLTSIIVDSNNRVYDSRNNCNAIIETSSNTLIAGCKNTIIPNSVTKIGVSAFCGCSGLTSIEIPNSVTSIGRCAFSYCSGLTNISIPNSVTSIGDGAFSGCSGLKITLIPNSVISIGREAFLDCTGTLEVHCEILDASSESKGWFYGASFTDIVIGGGVKTIGRLAFSGCSELTSVEIQNSVTTIGDYAFSGCSGLTNITIPNSVTNIGQLAFYNTAWYNNQPNGLVYAGKVAYGYKGTMPDNTSIALEDGTCGIAVGAFSGCTGLTNITIPNSVTTIGQSAFYNTAWYNNQPDGLVYAGKVLYKYKGRASGNDIIVKDGTLGITSYAFGSDNLLSFSNVSRLVIPNSVINIGDFGSYLSIYKVFNYSSVPIPLSTECSSCIYNNCVKEGDFITCTENGKKYVCDYVGNATSITLPEVYGIASGAFSGCSRLTSIEIPNSVISIGKRAFGNCSGLTNIEIPNSVTSIAESAFSLCSGLTNIEIPNSVTSIGWYAFYGCSGLTNIEIPNSVTSIGNEAFYLTKNIIYSGSAQGSPWGALTVNGEVYGDFIYSDAVMTHLTAYIGSGGDVVVPNLVSDIGRYAFYGCTELKSIEIPNSVTYIYPNAFDGCANLETLYCNTNEIGASFSNKTSLKRVEIGSSVTAIGNSAFLGCTGLTSITIPESVNCICNNAFYGCTNLRTVYNQSSLNIVKGSPNKGYVAYYADEVYNKGFMSNVANGKTYIQSYIGTEPSPKLPWADSIAASAFADCTSLTSVSIPGSVTGIGNDAFQGCTSLKNVTIEDFSSDIVMDACEALDSVNRNTTSYPTIGQIDCNSHFFGKVYDNNYMVLKPKGSLQIRVLFDIDNVNPDVPYDVYVVTLPLTAYDPSANPVKTIFKVQLSYYDESNNKVSFQRTSALETNATDIDTIKIATYTFPAGSERFEMQIEGYVNPMYVRNGTATTMLLLDCIILRPHQEVESDISLGNNDDYYSLFSDCPLESLYVGRNLNYENDAPFARQRKLKEVILGEDVTRIGNSAFYGCTNLTSVTVHNPVPVEITANTFTNRANAKLYVPFGSSAAYSAAPYWKDFGMNGSKVTDATILSVNEQETYSKLVYSRTFNNTKWQALYVPFSIPLDTLTKYGLEVAELNNIHMYDTDEDGSFDKTTLEFLYLKRGATEQNYPYLIKASATGEVTLTLKDVEVKATDETEIECSSTRKRFKIKGTYAGVSGSVMYNNHYYAMGGGTLVQMLSAEDNLKPQRWYMSIENKDGSPIEHYAPSLRIAIDGIELEDQETSIISIDNGQMIMDNDAAATYNLMGQQVKKMVNGLYIKNHKKIIVQ